MKNILLCLLCLSCSSPENQQQYYYNAANQIIDERIFYIKDKKTNLCFAAYNPYGNNSFFTNVPCSEDVEKLLVNK